MVTASLMRQVEALPPADRLVLIGRLWDSLSAEPADHEVREAQLGLSLHRQNPQEAVSWDLVMEELARKYY